MIKSAFIYRIVSTLPSAAVIEQGLRTCVFEPCAGGQQKAIGWVPPRQEHGALLESVDGQWVLKLMTETKSVPTQAVTQAMDEQLKRLKDATGRMPGKKEKRDLMSDVHMQLLPHAFPKLSAVLIWIDQTSGFVVVGASTQAKADDAVTMLVRAIDGLALRVVGAARSPAAAMAFWLHSKEAPHGFTVDRECELKACDESKAVVRYGRHALDTDEVAAHIDMGKLPTRLALTWNSRVSFVLTAHLQIKKIEILDCVFEEAGTMDADDKFDADVAIMTGELRQLIPALLDALGGEVNAKA